jgi:hypothetical protein
MIWRNTINKYWRLIEAGGARRVSEVEPKILLGPLRKSWSGPHRERKERNDQNDDSIQGLLSPAPATVSASSVL